MIMQRQLQKNRPHSEKALNIIGELVGMELSTHFVFYDADTEEEILYETYL